MQRLIIQKQFVESIKRLYENNKIDKEKIIELCNNGKITEGEKLYILNAH